MHNGKATLEDSLLNFKRLKLKIKKKLKIISPYNLAIMILSIYPTDSKIYIHTKPTHKH